MSLRAVEGLPYSAHGRGVITLADEDASFFNHAYIGTEHLTLGLLRHPSGAPIVEAGYRYEDFRLMLGYLIPRRFGVIVPAGYRGFSQRAESVIMQHAPESAKRRGSERIDPSDIFEGIIVKGDGVALTVFDSWGEGFTEAAPDLLRKMREIEQRL